MSETVQVALITAIPVVINIIMLNLHQKKLAEIHVQINSRMDELLRVTAAASRGEGKAEGIEAERDRPTR